jgi:digeranylgeranylglycerophospholipid reductase
VGSEGQEVLRSVLDAVVVGAGPAGSITARRLAERGHRVVMLEEHETVGTPVHCTGLLGFEAFDEFDLPRDTILGRAGGARFWGATGQSVTVRSDRIGAAVIDRALFDARLTNEAERAGVEVRRGYRAETITVRSNGVVVTGRGFDDAVRARVCVLACGASYRFHRPLGLGVPSVFLQSAQLETPFPQADDVEVRFGRNIAPAGFAWLVPLCREGRPYARAGLMSETRSRERFHVFLRALCDRAGLDAGTMPPPRLKMLPLGPVKKTYADRVVAVGDAAGLVKPTTGGGIYYGLLSGALAADVVADGLERDSLGAADLRRYETSWRRQLGQEIRVGLAFRRIAAKLSDESIDSLIELARVNGIVPLLQNTASFNWHSKAALALLANVSFRKIAFKSWRGAIPSA